MKKLIIIFSLLLGSCMTTRELVINGEKVYQVTCNGAIRTFVDCQFEASKKCAETGQHYVQLNSDGSASYATINNQLTPMLSRSMLYKCVDKSASNQN